MFLALLVGSKERIQACLEWQSIPLEKRVVFFNIRFECRFDGFDSKIYVSTDDFIFEALPFIFVAGEGEPYFEVP